MINDSIYDPNFFAPVIRYGDEVGSWTDDKVPGNITEILKPIRANFEEFLNIVIGLYGNIKPIYKNKEFSVLDTLVPTNLEDITYRDAKWSAIPFLQLFRTVPWSSLSTLKQTGSTYNSGVPLLLNAMKQYNKIYYSQWQAPKGQRQYYRTILGYGFKGLCDAFADADPPPFATEKVKEFRESMVLGTKAKKEYKYPYTSHKANKVGDELWDNMPSVYRMMRGQLWIFNGQCRNDKMILDWKDWDVVPESFDTIQATFSKNKEIKKTPVNWGVLF